jgi:arabinan endo-1,5-alpha-L-arabinosidase
VGDVFTTATLPTWFPQEKPDLWAPDIRYINGRYYLYYSVAHPKPTQLATIGVATAPAPAGPWTDSGGEVIQRGTCPTKDIDPAGFTDEDGKHYLYWGSFDGICAVTLNPEATRAVGAVTHVARLPGEAAYVIKRGGSYYLFVSTNACCSGAFSGYQVKVGRSQNPLGPFLDREGFPLTANHTAGSFVLAANGNRWVGVGHNSIATDSAGQDWMLYHGIPKNDPYVGRLLTPAGNRVNRRPLLLDRLDWIDGWPTVRGGMWASEDPQPRPAASSAPQQLPSAPMVTSIKGQLASEPSLGTLDPTFSDEFNDGSLAPQWSWVRQPAGREVGGFYEWPTQAKELYKASNDASVLLRPAPSGSYTVETKLTLAPQASAQQAGLVLYGGDNKYVKLVKAAIHRPRPKRLTQQTEFAKELANYGNMYVGPPSNTTWLRLSHSVDQVTGEHEVSAATSRDGSTWTWGGVWTMPPEVQLRIGLVSMNTAGATAFFDYLRVYRP